MITVSQPSIPEALYDHNAEVSQIEFQQCCKLLWDEVLAEVLDTEYSGRTHHNVGTYDKGCRGPLCRKAHREHPRRKSPAGSALVQRRERVYDPIIEYFHIVAKHRVKVAQQDILRSLRKPA